MGSARLSERDRAWADAERLGTLLAEEGSTVVTGGYGGLMEAVSRGAHSGGGHVVGLPMRAWEGLQPNRWNVELRWADGYATRLGHLLRCDAVIALPGGVGTLSEMAVVWASIQTEPGAPPLILLGDCWPPVVAAIGENLVVSDRDTDLLTLARTPEEAIAAVNAALREGSRVTPGPQG
jgi:uncharacterized protein (TIGR00725 family)